jgi:GT2 family glycosyltransferase
MKVSIVIPTYNRNKMLCHTIKNILLYRDQYYELIIVDQTREHDRETRLFLKKLKDEKKIIILNLSYPNLPNARNEGIKISSGDIVLFLDDDVEINEFFVPAHLSAYKNSNVGCATGCVHVVNPGKKDNIVFKDSFSVKTVLKALFFFFMPSKASYVGPFGVISNFTGTKKLLADTGIGCNISFRKEIFGTCGFFDTNYRGNAIREDTDMCFRVKKAGYKIVFNPQAALIHYMENSGGTRNSDAGEYWKKFFQNQCYFYLKNFSSPRYLIRFVLTLDLLRCRKSGVNAAKIFSSSYKNAKKLAAKPIEDRS